MTTELEPGSQEEEDGRGLDVWSERNWRLSELGVKCEVVRGACGFTCEKHPFIKEEAD